MWEYSDEMNILFAWKYAAQKVDTIIFNLDVFYFNTIEQLFQFVEEKDQLVVCQPCSRLLTGIPILVEFPNLRWKSNKTSLSTF